MGHKQRNGVSSFGPLVVCCSSSCCSTSALGIFSFCLLVMLLLLVVTGSSGYGKCCGSRWYFVCVVYVNNR